MQALIAHDVFQEEVRHHALAHEPALHVGEHAEDGVDLALVDERLELLHIERSLH